MSRSARALAVVALVAVVVAALLIGGALRTSSESVSYLRDVNRSYAEELTPVAARSNAIGRRLAALAPAMPGKSRAELEASLDTLVDAAEAVARQADVFGSPAPPSGGGDLTRAFADRATALVDLRRTVDRLLVLSPIPVATSATSPTAPPPTPPALSTAAAASDLERVGTAIASSNEAYLAGRRALRAGPGRARVPRSDWSSAGSWSATAATSLVAALVASPTLAAVHEVVLVSHSLGLDPAPVPPPSGASPTAGAVEVPPTKKLSVSAVVADTGNVPARDVSVEAVVAPQTGKPATRHSVTVSLAPGGSASVTLPPAPVSPDGHYTVTLSVTPPVANATPGAPTSEALSVTVGPPSPPAVAQVTPDKGPARGGTKVVIVGTNFGQATVVKFGTTDARFTIVSNTRIKAVAPPGSGAVFVTVENAGGPSGYSAGNQFTYKGGHSSVSTSTTTTSAAG